MKGKTEASVTSIELGSGLKRKPLRKKLLTPAERVEMLPKVTLKKRTIAKQPLSIQDLEMKADNIILK